MKQQFFVGDSVRICDTPQKDTDLLMGWSDGMDSCCGQVGIVNAKREYKDGTVGYYVVFASNISWYFAPEWLTIVERQWQKNTGEQPVDSDVLVEVKFSAYGGDKMLAGKFRWDFQDSCGDIVEWRIADSIFSNIEEQPEAIPPSHVALGDELAAVDATSANVSAEQDKKHSHYFKKCGYDYVDVYRVLKMFDVTDPCISHACKKLLVSGGRGFKDIDHDIQDVIDTLVRWQEMRKEDDGQS